MRVHALYAYPVKGCAALALEAASVDGLGLQPDRRFAILAGSGRVLTQRECPALALVRPTLEGARLQLELGGRAGLTVPLESFREPAMADVWGARVACRLAPGHPALDDYVGAAVRVAALDAHAARGFEDAAPVLVASLAALDALNRRLSQPVGMERFRPNVVVDEDLPWHTLSSSQAVLERIEPCERCEVVTIDQASGLRGGEEPLREIQARLSGSFGVYARVARAGRLCRGEVLALNAARAPR